MDASPKPDRLPCLFKLPLATREKLARVAADAKCSKTEVIVRLLEVQPDGFAMGKRAIERLVPAISSITLTTPGQGFTVAPATQKVPIHGYAVNPPQPLADARAGRAPIPRPGEAKKAKR